MQTWPAWLVFDLNPTALFNNLPMQKTKIKVTNL